MANPNIAALTNLATGTLSWTITADQVTLFGSGHATGNGGSPLTGKCPTPTNFRNMGGYTDDGSSAAIANTMTLCSVSNLSTTPSGVTQNGDAMTLLDSAQQFAGGSLTMSHYYRTNPDTSTTTTIGSWGTVPYSIDHVVTLAGYAFMGIAYFGNVDQTNPFGIVSSGRSEQRSADKVVYSYSTYQNNTFDYIRPLKTRVGDLIIGFASGTHFPYFTIADPNARTITGNMDSNASYGTLNGNHMWYIMPNNNFELPQVRKASNYFGHKTHSWGDYGNAWYSFLNIQSPRTHSELFTVPADKTIKINSIQLINPDVPNMYVDMQIEGLATGNTGILDSGNSSIITVPSSPGSVAVTNLCQAKKATMEKPTNVIEQPIWLGAGDKLTAKVVCNDNSPQFYRKNCDILISFEVVNDA